MEHIILNSDWHLAINIIIIQQTQYELQLWWWSQLLDNKYAHVLKFVTKQSTNLLLKQNNIP